ncbi:TRAP-type C4-dicarboxylate transport system permease small subunit [Hoeflea marina]|uniref:TRAP transporter small permease protein n=1 Tax=Hoeflea marina TaxID=274592 RepID=A0A317PEH8_9HYPH|nr:TRAP transporter small permease [Hoeflea marina]PWV98169.1 TRAP-type C4-dicarboxylate transport system permease small subunit [Hoeflea marina]
MIDRLDAGMRKLSAAMAVLGGLALAAVILSTVVSVTGRGLIPIGLKPIRGDFELVELGTGFAVFAFLGWCQINRQHAAVEILTMRMSAGANRFIDLVADVMMLGAALLITVRHGQGMLDKMSYGETTFILQYPIWWAYAAGLAGAVVFVLVCMHCVLLSLHALVTGKARESGGAVQ